MSTIQKTLLVTTGTGGTTGLSPLNTDLKNGWRVAQVVPMGGAGSGDSVRFAALVIIERSGEAADEILEHVEEQIEDDFESQLDEALEGGFIMDTADEPLGDSGPEQDGETGSGWVNPDL